VSPFALRSGSGRTHLCEELDHADQRKGVEGVTHPFFSAAILTQVNEHLSGGVESRVQWQLQGGEWLPGEGSCQEASDTGGEQQQQPLVPSRCCCPNGQLFVCSQDPFSPSWNDPTIFGWVLFFLWVLSSLLPSFPALPTLKARSNRRVSVSGGGLGRLPCLSGAVAGTASPHSTFYLPEDCCTHGV
jgi:hypothetical protein